MKNNFVSTYYNNIFSACYSFYLRTKIKTPRFTSVNIVCISQLTLILMFITIYKKLSGINILSLLPNKYYLLPIYFLWLYLLFRYYSVEKVEQIVSLFSQKNKSEKTFWTIVLIISFIFPVTCIALLLSY